MRTIVWFRGKDLRLTDHEPLSHAIANGEVIPLFVVDPFFFSREAAGELPHRMQFLIDALSSLQDNIAARGSKLLLAHGPSVEVIPALAKLWQADVVVAQRWVEPFGRARDERIARRLEGRLQLFEGETLTPPGTVLTGDGKPYSVYTPFARAFRRQVSIGLPAHAPRRLPPLPPLAAVPERYANQAFPTLETLGLTRNQHLQVGGERAGLQRLKAFLSGGLENYASHRDRMDVDGTSRLSADLKFGTLSIRQVWHLVARAGGDPAYHSSVDKFQSELLWREFTHHSLFARPSLLKRPFRREFAEFPWNAGAGVEWAAWRDGHTGYPVVDAAARQLLREGYVHNRARMIAASFLTKHLLIHYKAGEAHYMKFLTDGDWAQNNAGWQWSAGCGCDAQPYFRVFNPVTQGEKFDPDGSYVRKYVPELAHVDTKFIHKPWLAPAAVLSRARLTIGSTYPTPIVSHDLARQRFLALADSALKSSPRH